MCRSPKVMAIADIFFSLLLVTPLCMLWWSGCWKILDCYMLPENHFISWWLSLCIGSFISILGFYLTAVLENIVRSECYFTHVVVSRIFIIVYAFGILNYWRGMWNLSDYITGKGVLPSLIALLVCEIILLCVRGSGNTRACPFIVCVDHRQNFYESSPRFKTQVLCSHQFICALMQIA